MSEVASVGVGLGCMRLSTELVRDADSAVNVLVAALNHGVSLLDTAPCYALGDWDLHHNETLIAKALLAHGNPQVRIATKGGLHREGTSWVPDGRARVLRESCERSIEALGVSSLDLYLLHAVDPRTPIATSARALEALVRRQIVKQVGVCNVSLSELEIACKHAPISYVQVALGAFDDLPFRSGLFAKCRERGIQVLAHSPLGGPKRAPRLLREARLVRLAEKHETTPQSIVLAWLYGLGVVPLPGARRLETAIMAAHARKIPLDEEDWVLLDEQFPAAARAMGRSPAGASAMGAATSVAQSAERSGRENEERSRCEVLIVMGLPGSGKSRYAESLIEQRPEYRRFNRDQMGGKMAKVIRALDGALAEGVSFAVLDNTHLSRASRNDVVVVGRRRGVAVRCVHVATNHHVAQAFAVVRLVDRYGYLPTPDELRAFARSDPQSFGPSALFRARRELEPPTLDEGFDALDVIEGPASAAPAFEGGTRPGIAILAESLLSLSTQALRSLSEEFPDAAWHVFHWSLEPAAGSRSIADRAIERLQLDLLESPTADVCDHGGGPPICWCRPPLTGLLVSWMRKKSIAPQKSIVLGNSPMHRSMARALGLRYEDAALRQKASR